MHPQVEERKLHLANGRQSRVERSTGAQPIEQSSGNVLACLVVAGEASQRRGVETPFSMNWLGSSTASHSTPRMPEMAGSSTRVSK